VFTLEREKERKINFLDITIYREQSKLSTDIYRKPTFTDVIIRDSCHSKEHKMAAIRYLYNRMNSYQLSSDNMQKENNTIIQILTSNKCDASILETMNNRKVKTKYEGERKWVKFTYVGKQTRIITRFLRIPRSMFPSSLTTP
jgi:cellobiose phosphorylase